MSSTFISFARIKILLFLLLLGGLIFFKFPSAVSAECIITNYPNGCVASTQCGSTQLRCTGADDVTENMCAACVENPTTTSQTCSDDPGDPDDDSCPWNTYSENASTGLVCGGGVTCSGIYSNGCKYCIVPVCNYNSIQDNGESGVDCGGGGCPACPTPTPAPLPAPILDGNCSPSGTTLNYNWNSITGAVRYAIRINENGISIVIENNLPLTPTSYSRSSTPGKSYDAWIHAVDSRGVYSSSSNHSIFTCSAPAATAAPTLPPGITPTAGPTPVPDCVSCGTNANCGGNPPTFPASCPTCSGSWVYQSAGDSTCSSSAQGSLYPYCWVCSAPLPTATPGPTGAPTPTPTPAGCTARFSGTCSTQANIGSCEFGSCTQQTRTCWGRCTGGSSDGATLTSQSMVSECTNGGGTVTSVYWGSYAGSCPVAPTAPPTSTVSGIVFIDRDADGRKDTDEIGYSGGARLFLNTQTATTDATGAYQFTSITSGSYTLELDVPFGFSPNKSTGYNAATGTNKLTFTIPPAVTSADFGIVPYEVGVGGTMYTTLDSNCSTSITSQGRLSSKALSLSENYFTLTFNTATDINGVYSFSAPNQTLFPSSYAITPSDITGMRLVCAVVDGSTYETVRSTPYTYGDDSGENLTLTAQNPQKRVDFYYQLVQPWFQGKGADMRIDSGFADPVSSSARDPYAMLLNSNQSPGVIFSGSNSYSFCTGGAGACLERSSETQWVAGGTIYPETFTPAIPGTARTAYGYLLGLVQQNGQTINEIIDPNCYTSTGCDLAALAPGVYTNQAGTTDVYTRSSSGITFNREDYVFLINGNLHIQKEVRTVNTPNASTLVVSVSGDITVDKDVGGSSSSSTTHIAGLFSADSDFILESEGTDGDNCPSNEDNRLNMEGAIVANALLTGGTFQNNRTLCDNNSDYPVFYIEEQLDFILNFPDYLKHKSFVWQEVAP